MKLLVFSRKRAFSNIILQKLLKEGVLIFETKSNGFEFYNYNKRIGNGNCKGIVVEDFLYLTDKDVQKIEKYTKEPCEFLIISPHKSENKGKDIITIHYTGNFGKNEYGGSPKDFSIADVKTFYSLYQIITNTELEGLDFCVEATHHGPTIKRPLLFFEIGPDEKAYENVMYQQTYINILKKHIGEPEQKDLDCYILIGAPHYLDKEMVDDVKAKHKPDSNRFCLSHIIPKYALIDLLGLEDKEIKEILLRLIKCAQTEKIILNKSYIKSGTRLENIMRNLKK